jgi:hypothetical protein
LTGANFGEKNKSIEQNKYVRGQKQVTAGGTGGSQETRREGEKKERRKKKRPSC